MNYRTREIPLHGLTTVKLCIYVVRKSPRAVRGAVAAARATPQPARASYMRYVGKFRGCGGEMESRAHGAHEELRGSGALRRTR